MTLTAQEIRAKYNEFAPEYDFLEGIPDLLLGARRLRRELLQRASRRTFFGAFHVIEAMPLRSSQVAGL